MSSAQKNFGVILLQIALALFLVVSGIAVLQGGNGGDVGVAVNSIIFAGYSFSVICHIVIIVCINTCQYICWRSIIYCT